jgi:hypothetical protein
MLSPSEISQVQEVEHVQDLISKLETALTQAEKTSTQLRKLPNQLVWWKVLAALGAAMVGGSGLVLSKLNDTIAAYDAEVVAEALTRKDEAEFRDQMLRHITVDHPALMLRIDRIDAQIEALKTERLISTTDQVSGRNPVKRPR